MKPQRLGDPADHCLAGAVLSGSWFLDADKPQAQAPQGKWVARSASQPVGQTPTPSVPAKEGKRHLFLLPRMYNEHREREHRRPPQEEQVSPATSYFCAYSEQSFFCLLNSNDSRGASKLLGRRMS